MMTTRSAEPSRASTRNLFGFDFIDDADLAATAARIAGNQPVDGRLPLVVTPNVDDLVRLSQPAHAGLLRAEQQARYVLPDGQPIVWTSRLGGTPLTARLPGSSLFPLVWQRLIDAGAPAVVVASSGEVAAALTEEHPGARAVVPPFFDPADRSAVESVVDRCVDAVVDSGARHLFLGIGFPKQQHIALGVLEKFTTKGDEPPLVLLLGGSFNMHLGLVRRAPLWVQRSGLEWFYRFLLEPRRLFRRYFVTDVAFAPMMVREVLRLRRSDPT